MDANDIQHGAVRVSVLCVHTHSSNAYTLTQHSVRAYSTGRWQIKNKQKFTNNKYVIVRMRKEKKNSNFDQPCFAWSLYHTPRSAQSMAGQSYCFSFLCACVQLHNYYYVILCDPCVKVTVFCSLRMRTTTSLLLCFIMRPVCLSSATKHHT